MVEITKKTAKDLFEKVLSGEKKFEIRLNDEEDSVGDVLVLKEVDKDGNFTSREIKKKVTFLLKTKELPYWKEEDTNKYGYVVLSLE